MSDLRVLVRDVGDRSCVLSVSLFCCQVSDFSEFWGLTLLAMCRHWGPSPMSALGLKKYIRSISWLDAVKGNLGSRVCYIILLYYNLLSPLPIICRYQFNPPWHDIAYLCCKCHYVTEVESRVLLSLLAQPASLVHHKLLLESLSWLQGLWRIRRDRHWLLERQVETLLWDYSSFSACLLVTVAWTLLYKTYTAAAR